MNILADRQLHSTTEQSTYRQDSQQRTSFKHAINISNAARWQTRDIIFISISILYSLLPSPSLCLFSYIVSAGYTGYGLYYILMTCFPLLTLYLVPIDPTRKQLCQNLESSEWSHSLKNSHNSRKIQLNLLSCLKGSLTVIASKLISRNQHAYCCQFDNTFTCTHKGNTHTHSMVVNNIYARNAAQSTSPAAEQPSNPAASPTSQTTLAFCAFYNFVLLAGLARLIFQQFKHQSRLTPANLSGSCVCVLHSGLCLCPVPVPLCLCLHSVCTGVCLFVCCGCLNWRTASLGLPRQGGRAW